MKLIVILTTRFDIVKVRWLMVLVCPQSVKCDS